MASPFALNSTQFHQTRSIMDRVGHQPPRDLSGRAGHTDILAASAHPDRLLHKAYSTACVGRGFQSASGSDCGLSLEHAASALPVMQPDSSLPSHSGTHASSRSHRSHFSHFSELHSPLPVSTRPSRHRSSDGQREEASAAWEEPRWGALGRCAASKDPLGHRKHLRVRGRHRLVQQPTRAAASGQCGEAKCHGRHGLHSLAAAYAMLVQWEWRTFLSAGGPDGSGDHVSGRCKGG